jgi:sugar lactone lactonase YvrE
MNYALLTTRARRYKEPAALPPRLPEWNISEMALVASPGSPLLVSQGIAFSSDGGFMYVAASGSPARVVQQTLATPWDATSARTTTFTLTLSTNFAASVDISSDGNNLYALASTDGDSYSLLRYSMSQPWALATASLAETLPLATGIATGVSLSPGGDRFYIAEKVTGSVRQYAMPAAWSLSSSTLVNTVSLSAFGSADDGPEDVYVRGDGVTMYVSFRGTSVDARVVQLAMTTPWDVLTASHVRTYTDSAIEPPLGIVFRPNGARAFVCNSFIHQFDFVASGDISITGQPADVFSTNGSASFSVSATATNNATVQYQWQRATTPGGAWLNLTSQTSPTLSLSGLTSTSDGYRYRAVVSATRAASVTSSEATLTIGGFDYPLGNYSVSAQDTQPVGIAVGSNGSRMYVVGFNGDEVNEYSLSTAWKVSTASFTRRLSVAAQEGSPTGIFFSSDGGLMFLCGYNTDSVLSFSLSTPWDISTATASTSFSVSSKLTLPRALSFSPDGLKMFLAGGGSVNGIVRYALSVAWDITTSTHAEDFSMAAYDATPSGIAFNSNGTRMLVSGRGNNAIYEFSLATPWVVSTASLAKTSQLSFAPFGITATESKALVVDTDAISVREYNLSP